jgi:methylated-DNA-[protein]-cysteine S-methyltransferase
MNLFFDIFRTPVGNFSIAVDASGALAATAFGGERELRSRIGPCQLGRDQVACTPARRQVLAYFAGERRDFDLPLADTGTGFQRRVWTALQQIPFGETRSYGELARTLRSSARAIGRANATNPVCLIVPCHRVIGADGSLTGFAFGEAIKLRLLAFEGARGFARPRAVPRAA